SSCGPTSWPARCSRPRRSRSGSSPRSSAPPSSSSSSAACTSRPPEPPARSTPDHGAALSLVTTRRVRVATLTLVTALLAACGGSGSAEDAETRPDEGHYPVTVENCGQQVTIESEPTN